MTPPSPAMSPRFTSGRPELRGVLAATIRSQASAISKPPPSAHPSTAAMSGLRTTAWVSPPNPRPGRIGVSPFANAFRSMPALNVPPAPVSTPTDSVGSASSRSSAAASWTATSRLTAFFCAGPVDGDRQDAVVTLGEHQLRRYFGCGHFAFSCSGAAGITFCSRSWSIVVGAESQLCEDLVVVLSVLGCAPGRHPGDPAEGDRVVDRVVQVRGTLDRHDDARRRAAADPRPPPRASG